MFVHVSLFVFKAANKIRRKKLRRKSMEANHSDQVRNVTMVLFCVTVIGTIYLGVLNKAQLALINPIILSSFSDKFAHNNGTTVQVSAQNNTQPNNMTELELRLSKAANQNRTVIITSLNAAWSQNNSMIDLFLQSFRVGNGTQHLLKNLLIVAVDNTALHRCRQIHEHCYLMKTGVDFSAEELFMTEDYLKMMWRRLRFFGQVLEAGYNYIFSDTDILWFRDPFTRYSPSADMNIASDGYNGQPHDLGNRPNGGYMYVRSNEKTISFFKFWYESKSTYPGKNEQDVLNLIKVPEIKNRGLEVVFLDTKYFRGYCQTSQDLSLVYTMHANCCKGLKAKLHDLRNTLSDWEKYIMNPLPGHIVRKDVHWTPPQACQHSWDP